MASLRILHIVPTYVPAWRYGGPIVAVHGLCRALANLGHEVHVFTTNVDGPFSLSVNSRKEVDLNGVRVRYFPSRWFRFTYWAPELERTLSAQIDRFNLIHLHSIFLWPTWVGARLAQASGKPYILSPRGMLDKKLILKKNRHLKSLLIHLTEKKTLERAAAIHVTSDQEAKNLADFRFNLPPVYVVPNGTDLSPAGSPLSTNLFLSQLVEKEKPFILFLGRINWKKGLERLIQALSYAPRANLIIAGNDENSYQKPLETLAKKTGVEKRIHFVGFVRGPDKEFLLKSATALVLPSYSENFGNVVLEAMASGCPVIVSPNVGLAEIVDQYQTGIVVDTQPQILGQKINDLLQSNRLLTAMSRNGRKVAQEQFSWERIADKMQRVYSEIISA